MVWASVASPSQHQHSLCHCDVCDAQDGCQSAGRLQDGCSRNECSINMLLRTSELSSAHGTEQSCVGLLLCVCVSCAWLGHGGHSRCSTLKQEC